MAYQSTQLLFALLVITTSSLAHGAIFSTFQTQISGILVCSASGNPDPAGNSSALAGVIVYLRCNNGTTRLDQVLTNAFGVFTFTLGPTQSPLFNPSQCDVRASLPISLGRCPLLPSNGMIRGVPAMVDTVQTQMGSVTRYTVRRFDRSSA